MRRKTRSRRPGQGSDSGQSFFGGTGWLFADLMVALAMVFLVATVGFRTPPAKPKPVPSPTPVKTHAPKKPIPALELQPVKVTVSNLDYNGLLNNSSGAVNSVRNAILKTHRLDARKAGLVLLFGGAGPSDSQEAIARRLDAKVQSILTGQSGKNGLFQGAVFVPYSDAGGTQSTFQMSIYLFKT